MRRTIGALIVVGVLWLAAQPRCAWACDCDVPDLATARDQAVAVFAGQVERIEPAPGPQIALGDPVRVTVRVSRVWEGDVSSTTMIATARSEASCGYEFQAGRDYVIYAREPGTTLINRTAHSTMLETGLCSRTRPLAEAQDDLVALGAGQIPVDAPQPSPSLQLAPTGMSVTSTVVAIVALVVVLAGGGVILKRLSF